MHCLQPLRPVLGDQGIQHRVEGTAQHRLEVKAAAFAGQPVIGHAVLRKVIGPDTIRAVAGADLALPFGGKRGTAGLLFALVKLGAHDGQRAVLVLVLTALVLTFHHYARRQVGYANRRIGRIYMLAARSGGAVAELSDGVSTVGFAPGKNGALVSWRRGGKEIVEGPGKGMLDEWLFRTVNETVSWRVTRFAAVPDPEVTLEAELPPPRNAAPGMVSLQGLKLKKTAVLRNGELFLRGEIVNPKAYPLNFSFRVRNYPQMSLPWKILSGVVRYDGSGTVTARRSGRSIPFSGRGLNDRYDGAPFEITSPDGILSIHAPAADGVMVWNGGNSPSTVEPGYSRTLGPGKKFSFESRLKWRR